LKFHVIAGSLLIASVVMIYLILAGVQSDFEQASSQIKKETFESFKAHRDNKRSTVVETVYEQKEEPAKVFNDRQGKASAQVVSRLSAADEPQGLIVEKIDGTEYWCREAPVQKLHSPVKCLYPSSCFGCENSHLIPPEVEAAVPFCDNGRQAALFSIECCPSGISGSDFDCPSARECLHADAVPKDFCTCQNRSDCKMMPIGDQIQCVCIQ
jgi:hypothetical protein